MRNYNFYINIQGDIGPSQRHGSLPKLTRKQQEHKHPRFERWKVKEVLGNNRFHLENSFGEQLSFVRSINRSPGNILAGSYVLVGFYYDNRQDPYIFSVGVALPVEEPLPPLPPLLTNWFRLGIKQKHAFYLLGEDENGSSEIRLIGKSVPSTQGFYNGSIVRVKQAEIIYADGQLIKTLDTSTDTTETCDVSEDVTCLDIGEVTGVVSWLTHGTQVVAVPLGCEEATALGYDDGYSLGLGDWFLYNDGAFDCVNGDGYAWVDFGYESNILDGEDNASSFYNWSLPGDVEFEADADDCYRAGLVEGARVAYDEGSTDEGCGSGA